MCNRYVYMYTCVVVVVLLYNASIQRITDTKVNYVT